MRAQILLECRALAPVPRRLWKDDALAQDRVALGLLHALIEPQRAQHRTRVRAGQRLSSRSSHERGGSSVAPSAGSGLRLRWLRLSAWGLRLWLTLPLGFADLVLGFARP